MLPTSAGVEPATSWSPVGRRIQQSHRGRLTIQYDYCTYLLQISGHITSQHTSDRAHYGYFENRLPLKPTVEGIYSLAN